MIADHSRLRITFLVPTPGEKPIGGHKVTYEYSNFLASRGHQVNVVHGHLLYADRPLTSYKAREIYRTFREYLRLKIGRRYRPDKWFTVGPTVNMMFQPSLAAKHIPDADIVFATAWETSEWAMTYPRSKGRRFYLIQHLETWAGMEERVMATWTAPFEKIVIAPWLQRIAIGLGERSHLINNGLDFKRFGLDKAAAERDPHQVLMLYHCVVWKGSADGLAAFALAKQAVPKLKLALFGIDPAPPTLPEGVTYFHQPSPAKLRELYNSATIFVSPSWAEGWALPPAEALTCGCAIAVTDIGGHEAYAEHEVTALLSPIKQPAPLAANIVRLVRDQDLRLKLSRQGNDLIRQFTWERAGCAMEALLLADPTTRIQQESAPEMRELQPATK